MAKYDEVAITLDFARDLCKQVNLIATNADREAKKQAKKVFYYVLLINIDTPKLILSQF